MRNQSRLPWNQARKSAQPSSPTNFYNIWRHFWGKSRGSQREIRKSRTPKLLVADPSFHPESECTGLKGSPIKNPSPSVKNLVAVSSNLQGRLYFSTVPAGQVRQSGITCTAGRCREI